MAIIDTLRAFTEAVVSRTDAGVIENALQAFYQDLHSLAGVAAPVTTTTTITTVQVPSEPAAPVAPEAPTA